MAEMIGHRPAGEKIREWLEVRQARPQIACGISKAGTGPISSGAWIFRQIGERDEGAGPFVPSNPHVI